MRKFELGLKAVCVYDLDAHPIDLMKALNSAVEMIDNFTKVMRAKKLTRVGWMEMKEDLYLEWGEWSHDFNKSLRLRIKLLDSEKKLDPVLEDMHQRLIYTYAYWWNRHHWVLQVLLKRSKLAGISCKKGIEKGSKTLAKCINGDFHQDLSPAFKALLNALKKKDYQKEFKTQSEEKSHART